MTGLLAKHDTKSTQDTSLLTMNEASHRERRIELSSFGRHLNDHRAWISCTLAALFAEEQVFLVIADLLFAVLFVVLLGLIVGVPDG